MTNQELKELIEWQENGGEIEYRNEGQEEWNLIGDDISEFLEGFNNAEAFRKREEPKLTHEQIMNNWLYDKKAKQVEKVNSYNSYDKSYRICGEVLSLEKMQEEFEIYKI